MMISNTTENFLISASGAAATLIGVYIALATWRKFRSPEKHSVVPEFSVGLIVVITMISTASTAMHSVSSISIDWRSLLVSIEQFISNYEFQLAALGAALVAVVNSLYYFARARVTRSHREGEP